MDTGEYQNLVCRITTKTPAERAAVVFKRLLISTLRVNLFRTRKSISVLASSVSSVCVFSLTTGSGSVSVTKFLPVEVDFL